MLIQKWCYCPLPTIALVYCNRYWSPSANQTLVMFTQYAGNLYATFKHMDQ